MNKVLFILIPSLHAYSKRPRLRSWSSPKQAMKVKKIAGMQTREKVAGMQILMRSLALQYEKNRPVRD